MLDTRDILHAGLLAGVLLLAGCGGRATQTSKSSDSKSPIVAQANTGYRLTIDDFKAALEKSILKPRGGYLSQEELREFRDSMVADTLTGFAADEEVDLTRHWAENWSYRGRYNKLLLGAYFEHVIYPDVTADSAEVVAYYNENLERFTVPEQIEFSHLLVTGPALRTGPDSLQYKGLSDSALAEAAREYAFMMLRKLDSGMSPKEVAARYSLDISAPTDSGYGGWMPRNSIRPPFDSVAFSLEPGTYSQPYQDSDGWHVIMVHQHVAGGPRPLTDSAVYQAAHSAVLTQNATKKARIVVDSLAQGGTLVINEPLLDSNLLTLPDSLWYAIINNEDTVDVLLMRNADDTYRSRTGLQFTAPDQRREILMSLMRQFSVVQAARSERLDTLPSVTAIHRDLRHETAKMIMLRDWFDRSWMPADSVIEAYYRDHPEEFLVEKPLRVQHIVTQDSLLAVFLRDQARSGVDFMELAKEYYPGDTSIRAELADLGFIGPRDVDTNFYLAANVLPVGDISEPVKSKFGWHVIKMLERHDSKTLDEARTQIITKLAEERRDAEFSRFQKRLFAKYDVKFANLPDSLFLEPLAYRKK